MTETHTITLLILGSLIITYAMRGPAMVFFGQLAIPAWLNRALGFVPIAVLAAVTTPAMVAPKGEIWLDLSNSWLLASLAAVAVSAWRKDLVTPVLAGIAVFAVLQNFGPFAHG